MELNKINVPEYVQIVVNPYNNETSVKRKGIIIQGPWIEEIASYIKDNEVKALYLNSAKGWNGSDYSFLSKLDTIEELNIISSNAAGLRAMESMANLIEFSITTSTKEKIDFTKLSSLKKCYLYWWDGAESILACANLESLYLDKLQLKDFSKLENLSNLNSLTIANSQIDTLAWLKDFKNLYELELFNCKKLDNFESIIGCTKLKKLVINGCKHLDNLRFIKELNKLEILVVSDCGELDSLRPLEELKTLKALSFAGNTQIKDGDLSCIDNLPKLSMLMFQGKKHYSHKLIKKWDWNNLNHPSKLLEKC